MQMINEPTNLMHSVSINQNTWHICRNRPQMCTSYYNK